MSVAEKMPLTKIEVSQGKKRKLYLVSTTDAAAAEVILARWDERSSDDDYIDSDDSACKITDKLPYIWLYDIARLEGS